MRGATTALNDIFAANRAAGRIALSVAFEAGVSRRRRVYEDGPLRVRFPKIEPGRLEAVIVNTAGGITGGDRSALDIAVGAGAGLTVTTTAAEKVYRSLGPDAEVTVKLDVASGGTLAWLPQETILFDGSRLKRSIEIDLAENASLVMAEAVVFGRQAMGEAVTQGAFTDRWRVRRGGKLLFAETLRLDGAIADKLAEPAIARGGVAIANVLFIPGDDAAVERVRALDQFCGEVGISSWNGLAVARLCAKDGAALRRDLVAVLGALGHAVPRSWLH